MTNNLKHRLNQRISNFICIEVSVALQCTVSIVGDGPASE